MVETGRLGTAAVNSLARTETEDRHIKAVVIPDAAVSQHLAGPS